VDGDAVGVAKLGERALPGAPARRGECGVAEALAENGVSDEAAERRCEGARIVGRNEEPGLAVADELRGAACRDSEGRKAGRSGLEDDLAEGVRGAREAEDVGAGVDPGERGATEPTEERDALGSSLLEPGTGRADADDDEAGAGAD
jgi:hypothetical protein